MRKLRVFVSLPMAGRTEDQIAEARYRAVDAVRLAFFNHKIEVVDSFVKRGEPWNGANPLYYLGESIKLLANADVVCFAKGWQEARGCCVEHECAKQYGIDRFYEVNNGIQAE